MNLQHDASALGKLGAGARLYLRPTGFVDGPEADPSAARCLAGGPLWFGLLHVIAREGDSRSVSVMLPVRDVEKALEEMPMPLRDQAIAQWTALTAMRVPLDFPGESRTLRFDRAHLMGILNLSPDSFSNDGHHGDDPHRAVRVAFNMMSDGASLVDIGAESTRPKATAVWEGDEIERLRPVVEKLDSGNLLWSVDTRKAAVMRYALGQGCSLVNDVSGLTFDPESLGVIAQATCPVVIMHAQGTPDAMQDKPSYDDVALDIFDWFAERIAICAQAGIDASRLILDPGIGFGKTLRHNLDILNNLSLFHALGCPLLLGASRKRFIGALSREEPADERLPGSLTAVIKGLDQGVQMFRVHDVAQTAQALKIWQGLRDAAVCGAV